MKNLLNKIAICILFLFLSIEANAQITLNNASFEDEPGDATIPMGWFACQRGTTPDILPGYWGVYDDPSEGETYVGIITRTNGTFESIGQRLSDFLKPNNCYQFYLDLAHSNIYSGYSGAIKLRIWVGDSKCNKSQMIFESDYIKHTEWETYLVKFKCEGTYNYINFEAFYKEGSFSFKGNILIDNVSPIYPCDRT